VLRVCSRRAGDFRQTRGPWTGAENVGPICPISWRRAQLTPMCTRSVPFAQRRTKGGRRAVGGADSMSWPHSGRGTGEVVPSHFVHGRFPEVETLRPGRSTTRIRLGIRLRPPVPSLRSRGPVGSKKRPPGCRWTELWSSSGVQGQLAGAGHPDFRGAGIPAPRCLSPQRTLVALPASPVRPPAMRHGVGCRGADRGVPRKPGRAPVPPTPLRAIATSWVT
jgi:hypothetical protein